jgi:hypothetical protein
MRDVEVCNPPNLLMLRSGEAASRSTHNANASGRDAAR